MLLLRGPYRPPDVRCYGQVESRASISALSPLLPPNPRNWSEDGGAERQLHLVASREPGSAFSPRRCRQLRHMMRLDVIVREHTCKLRGRVYSSLNTRNRNLAT